MAENTETKTETIEVTKDEKGWLEFARFRKEYDKDNKVLSIKKDWEISRLKISFSFKSRRAFMGRFGGGWNWKVGVQGSGNQWIFSLLTCTVSFYWKSKD